MIRLDVSDGRTIEMRNSDTVDLILNKAYASPFLGPKAYTETLPGGSKFSYYVVKWFDIEKQKYCTKKFTTTNDSAQQEAQTFVDTLPPYDPYNISKYVVTVRACDLLKNPKFYEKFYRIFNREMEYEEKPVPIDPYIFGVWLGDGTSRTCGITNIDSVIIDAYKEYATSLGLDVRMDSKNITYTATCNMQCKKGRVDKETVVNILNQMQDNPLKTLCKQYNVSYHALSAYAKLFTEHGMHAIDVLYDTKSQNKMYYELNKLKVIGNKHLPDIYFYNSKHVRLQVLAGFIDTDGSLSGKSYDIIQGIKNEKVFDDIKRLAESLGFKMSKTTCYKTCTYKGEKKKCEAVRGWLTGDLFSIPTRVQRKKVVEPGKRRHDLPSFKICLQS